MKEADIHKQTVSKASADLIEKCEIISLKHESSDPDLANRATVLVNKANKEDEDYSRKLTDFKCEFSEFFKLPTNEVQGVSSVPSSNSNSRENSCDRNKVFL